MQFEGPLVIRDFFIVHFSNACRQQLSFMAFLRGKEIP
jgi:hypothetical protein